MSEIEKLRIGTGFDVHAFEEGRELILGGVKIAFEKGLAGHSDADALLHAMIDAILGALGLGDIGTHFPSHDERWKGASSLEFLDWTHHKVKEMGASILSIDSVIMAQAPRMSPHIPQIRQSLAKRLELEESRLHIKSTTTDYLGFLGRGEGLAVQSTCLVRLA